MVNFMIQALSYTKPDYQFCFITGRLINSFVQDIDIMILIMNINKNIPSLPVAGITVVGVTGVRSKRITRQVQLNILINEIEFENTFLVVKGLSLDVILGNDFLERNGAIIDFNKQIVKFENGNKPVRVKFKKVVDLSLIHI